MIIEKYLPCDWLNVAGTIYLLGISSVENYHKKHQNVLLGLKLLKDPAVSSRQVNGCLWAHGLH